MVKPAQYKCQNKITVDFSGKLHAEMNGSMYGVGKDGQPNIYPWYAISTFNGTEERVLDGKDKTSLRRGMITSERSDTLWTLDPREMTTWYSDRPVSQFIAEKKGCVIGTEKQDEHEVLIVETEVFVDPRKSKWKNSFWIDPNRGFVVVRRSSFYQFPDVDHWVENSRITGYDYHEIEPGIWLPSKAVDEAYAGTRDEAQEDKPHLMWKFVIQNSNWVVNPKVDESIYTLQFPKGVNVDDHIDRSQKSNVK